MNWTLGGPIVAWREHGYRHGKSDGKGETVTTPADFPDAKCRASYWQGRRAARREAQVAVETSGGSRL